MNGVIGTRGSLGVMEGMGSLKGHGVTGQRSGGSGRSAMGDCVGPTRGLMGGFGVTGGFCGAVWGSGGPDGILGVQVGFNGSRWDSMGLSGSRWDSVGRSGAPWVQMGSCWSI